MMISPEAFIAQFEHAEYADLIEAREGLLVWIRDYEKKEYAGDRSGGEWKVHPSPEVRYQVYLEYLSELCRLMKEKYNTEYVWGDKKLSTEQRQ